MNNRIDDSLKCYR